MRHIQFSGRVLPGAYKVTLSPIPSISWKMPDLELEIVQHVKIMESNVTVDCECSNFDPDRHLVPIYIRALDIARAPVDLFGFARGMGFFVYLDTLTEDNGRSGPIALQDEMLRSRSLSLNNISDEKFLELLSVFMSEPAFFLTMQEMMLVLKEGHTSPRSAFRAIEGIRHLLSPGEKNKERSWEKLGSTLNVAKSFIDPVRNTSVAPRHGDPTHVPGSLCTDVTLRAWTIMDRYIEFRKKGGITPLPLVEFPTLT